MMKYFIYALQIMLLLGFFKPVPTEAFLLTPPGPASPTLDAPSDTAKGFDAAVTKTTAMLEQASAKADELSTQMKSAKEAGPFSSFMNALKEKGLKALSMKKEKGEPVVEGTQTVEECKIADIRDEASVSKAFKTLFATYPADILKAHPLDSEIVKKAYRQKAVEFSNDVMLEAYIVSRKLEERMLALKEDYQTLSECFVDGKGGSGDSCQAASDTEDDIGIWTNYYRINLIYDSLLRIAEELTAIEAQYQAAQAMRVGIEPLLPKDDENKPERQSFNLILTQKMAFAQLWTQTNDSMKIQTSQNDENTLQDSRQESLKQLEKDLQRVDFPKQEVSSLLKGTENQFENMLSFKQLYAKLKEAEEIHNLKVQMPSYRNIFENYHQIETLHNETLKRLSMAEDCAVNYLGKFYQNPSQIWYGSGCQSKGGMVTCNDGRKVNAQTLQSLKQDDILCGENNTQICSSFGINKYSSRGGFSGWLLSSYQTVKAETALELTADDFSSPLTDPQMNGSITGLDLHTEKLQAEYENDVSDSGLLRPSEEEANEEDMRQANLLAFHVGAEAAKAIATDMASSSPKWGAVKTPYPLWEDEKYFYREYLNEKYQNIKLFITNLDMRGASVEIVDTMLDSLVDGLINEMSTEKVKTYGKSVVTKLTNMVASVDNATADFEDLNEQIEKNNQAMQRLKTQFENKLQALNASKKAIYKMLDDKNIALNTKKQNYNNALSDKRTAEISIAEQNSSIAISQSRGEGKVYATDVYINMATEDKANAEQTKIKKQEEMNTALNGVETLRENIDSLKAQVEDVNNQIERTKSEYAAAVIDLERQNEENIQKAFEKAQKSAPLLKDSEVLKKAFLAVTDKSSVQQLVFSSLASNADDLLRDAKTKALQRVDQALEQLEDMGEELYNPANASKVLKIHTDMINDIKKPDLKTSLGVFEALVNPLSVRQAAAQIFEKAFVASTCQKVACDNFDTLYFVGMPPKAKDFAGPKQLAYPYTPPLREIVHFDTADYDNVIKTDDEKISREALFNYGEELPQIWHQILKPHAFIEKDFDVRKMLKSYDKNTSGALLNAGSYPCKVGNYGLGFIDGRLTLWQNQSAQLQACTEIESMKILPTGLSVLKFKNGQSTTGQLKTSLGDDGIKSVCGYSELATLLAYDNALTFNPKIKEIYKYFEDIAQSDNQESDSLKDKVYKEALLTRNQFGDYLNYVELETSYQETLNELGVKLEETRQSLKEQLAKIGYEPEQDFDLADEDTYREILEKLESAKNQIVAQAHPQISKLEPANEALEENIIKLNNMIGALELDKDEVVMLSDNMKPDTALSEKIKSKTVDAEALNRYNQEAQEAMKKEIESFGTPYCATFCALSF